MRKQPKMHMQIVTNKGAKIAKIDTINNRPETIIVYSTNLSLIISTHLDLIQTLQNKCSQYSLPQQIPPFRLLHHF